MVLDDFLKSKSVTVVELYPNEASDLVSFDLKAIKEIDIAEDYHTTKYPQIGVSQQEGKYQLLLDKDGVIGVAARQKGEVLGYAIGVCCRNWKADYFPFGDEANFKRAIYVSQLGLDQNLSHLELLINELKTHLKDGRYTRLVMNVPEDNLSLLNNLKKLGFKATALVRGYYGHLDSIFMEI